MSVATAVGSPAAINATSPFAFPPFQGNYYFTLPPVAAAATVPSPTARDRVSPAVPRRRQKRRAYMYRAQGRREAKIYSWGSRSFLAVDPRSETVTLSKHGNSIYGMFKDHTVNQVIHRPPFKLAQLGEFIFPNYTTECASNRILKFKIYVPDHKLGSSSTNEGKLATESMTVARLTAFTLWTLGVI